MIVWSEKYMHLLGIPLTIEDLKSVKDGRIITYDKYH